MALRRPSTRLNATLLGVGVAVVLGVLMDQVSARLCPEYFTVLHDPVPGLTDPALVGLVWGVLGASGGGVALGYSAGLAATLGPTPPMTTRELVRPALVTALGIASVTAAVGGIVWWNGANLIARLGAEADGLIPPSRQLAALTVACYHMTAYASAVAGSVLLCVWIGRERRKRVAAGGAAG